MTPQDTMRLALSALEGVLDKHEGLATQFWSCSGGVYEAVACNEAIEALRYALAQQGEQPYVLAEYTRTDGYRQWESVGAWLYQGDKIAVISAGAAPAAQPACKQDLQVPTVKENLTVETEQERYVRMCPDIECGRKKRCTRMVGVSCMSRAGIAPAAQPDTWTDDGGWTFPIEKPIIQSEIKVDKPLTDEQIEEMHEEQDFIATLFQVRRIVRATEHAHGIGADK